MSFKSVFILRTFSTQIKSTYYVTSPIYYVNAQPHIGHLYSSVIADASCRWHRLLNKGAIVKFATGTDEHGSKIQQASLKNNAPINEYCNNISLKYKNLSDQFNIDYTDFIRTTYDSHIETVKLFWTVLMKNGHIYLDKYEGWYCTSDESFLSDSQLKEILTVDGRKMMVSEESGHPVEWTEEENYKFRLSLFQDDLVNWLKKNENIVRPKKFQKILLDSISKEALPDVSISRPSNRVHWGIGVPGDETQTIYVWLDALVNYLTVAGYSAGNDGNFSAVWPPNVQVIGKDILKFHGVYWPAFLMAANLEPPRSLLCHSHWTVDGEKMSKSKNNVVCPFGSSELYTTDGLRYFLLREGVPHNDGNFSDTKVVRILNSELADTLGNLLNRCSGTALNPNQEFPEIEPEAFQSVSSLDVTKRLLASVEALPDNCKEHYENFQFYKVVDSVIATLHLGNLFFETMKPWQLKKRANDNRSLNELNVVLHVTLETLRVSAILLQPIIPNLAQALLNKINVPKTKRYFNNSTKLSWYDSNFATVKLSPSKTILFKKILSENEKKKDSKSV